MEFQLIRKRKIVINTTKSNEEINASLVKVFGHQKNGFTKFLGNSNKFLIQKTLRYNILSTIVANGTIIIGVEKNFIRLEISAPDTYLKLFALVWYGLNILMFLFLIGFTFVNGSFTPFIFLPILLIFIGYGLTTATLQLAMNKIIKEVKKAV